MIYLFGEMHNIPFVLLCHEDILEEIVKSLEYDDAVRLGATCKRMVQVMDPILKRKLDIDVVCPASNDMMILRSKYCYTPHSNMTIRQTIEEANVRKRWALIDLLTRRWYIFWISDRFRIAFANLLTDPSSYLDRTKLRDVLRMTDCRERVVRLYCIINRTIGCLRHPLERY